MSDTQHTSVVPIDENKRQCLTSAQWMLESAKDRRTPIYHHNELALYICGEEAFTKVAEDLKGAKSTVEIICLGLDPAMELIRDKTVWPRGETWGSLLQDVAAGKYNQNKPVRVRVLSWYGYLGTHLGTNTMPGYGQTTPYEVGQAMARGMGAELWSGGDKSMPPMHPPADLKTQREVFNASWYRAAFKGQLKNLFIRTRDVDVDAASRRLYAEPGKRGLLETLGLEQIATDHQKTILIDYEHEGGADAVGYVLGLNSLTDYWDTQQHLFNDPRRGASWEGANDAEPGLKPYQDYACRIRGAALVAVSKNFTDAWNRAKGMGEPLARTHDVQSPPRGLGQKLLSVGQRALIVRTQPEENDQSIQRLYRQASSFARQYLYVENQYFQYAVWAQELKADRLAFAKGWQAKGNKPADLPTLHVMVLTPTAELPQMVPRTYDAVKALGQGQSMPNQDKQTEDELERNKAERARWEAHVKSQADKGAAPDPDLAPAPLSALAKSAKEVGDKENIAKELGAMGMRTLVGSLWTYDHHWQSTQRTALAVAQALENNPVHAQRYQGSTKKLQQARYREIYIHSKLMIIDDSMFTLGSANLNIRSMATDAEINIASDDIEASTDLRRRVWELHTGGAAGCNPESIEPKTMADAFDNWVRLMTTNAQKKTTGNGRTGFLFPFYDERTSWTRLA